MSRGAGFALTLTVALALVTVVGCGKKVGEECQISGSGFTAEDPCRTQCLERWTAYCPDGEPKHLPICAGEAGCTPGGCPDGQLCYEFDDPFDILSYCLPADACGGALSPTEGARWERESAERAAALRKQYEKHGQSESRTVVPDGPPSRP